MAKKLNIGVGYHPNNERVDKDGNKVNIPCVTFYFDADANTCKQVAGALSVAGLKGFNYSTYDGSLYKKIKEEDWQKFLQSQTFDTVIKSFENYGYVFDQAGKQNLAAEVEHTIKTTLDDDGIKDIENRRDSFIDQIIKAMEENLNDPNFLAYVNSVGSINWVGDDKLGNLVKLSAKNTVMVLSQWVNAGRSGQPTYLATERQWKMFFNRQVNKGNGSEPLPLYVTVPQGTHKQSVNSAMAMVGMSRQAYDSNAMYRKQIDTLTNDRDYGNNNATAFSLNGASPYYDISDTELIPGKDETYDFFGSGVTSNIDSGKTSDDDIANRQTFLDSTSSGATPENDIKEKIAAYAQKNNDSGLLETLKIGTTYAIRYLADHTVSVRRENDPEKKKLYSNIIAALTMKRFKVGVTESDNILRNNLNKLTSGYKGINRRMFDKVSSEFQNLVYIILGVNEGITKSTFDFVLNAFGMTIEDYYNLPADENEAMERYNTVRESFIRTFNNLLR